MRMEKKIVHLEDYEPLVGKKAIDRVRKKAETLKDLHVVHINSTYYGGGVAELLSALTLLMNDLEIKTGWRLIQGSPDFFSITKKMHNALQGGEINLSDRKIKIYEEVIYQNAVRNHLDHDMVIVHDPQPLLMIHDYRRRGPWVWRCHVDLTAPNKKLWNYMKPHIENYDAVIVSCNEYKQDIKTPQIVFSPAIDPFSIKNREMSERDIEERLSHYKIPTDLPIVAQVSRFDRWKDPEGVIEAFKIARKKVDATLVLLGNVATDDPEGERVYESLMGCREERILILSKQDTALVNALQRRADVILQKSLREGFGLTVAEAMWKGTPVIGGNVGGIRYQIKDGENGYLVSSIKETADRIVKLIKDKDLRNQMGAKARESVKDRYLMFRYMEKHLDLLNAFQPNFKLGAF